MKICKKPTDEEIRLFASLLSEGAIAGHFDKGFIDQEVTYNYLNNVNITGIVLPYKQKGNIVVFRKETVPVCFALVCSSLFPKYKTEILLFSVNKNFRKKGIGTKAIELIMEESKGTKILARCTNKSMSMVRILRKLGFKNVNLGKSKSGNINLASKLIKA